MTKSASTKTPPRGVRLIPHLFWEYPRPSILICCFLILASVVEGFGIATILPLITTIAGNSSGNESTLSRLVADFMALVGLQLTLVNMLLVIVIGMTLKAVFVVLTTYQVGTAMAFVQTDLRFRLLRALMLARWSYFTRQSSGEIANAMTVDVNGATGIMWGATLFCTMALQVFVYLGLAMLVSWQVTLAAIVGGGAMMLMLGFLIRIARQAGFATADAYNSLLSRLIDCLGSIKSVKAMGAEHGVQPMLEADNELLFRAARKLLISKEAMTGVQEPIIVIFLAAGLYVASSLEWASFDELIVMALLFHRTVSRAGKLQAAYHQLASSEGLYHSLYRKTAVARQNQETHKGKIKHKFTNVIDVRGVVFSYGEKEILQNLTLQINRGRITAIHGPSGVGKSTLTDLVLGLQTPDEGEVLIDGIDLTSINISEWRKNIGYVPQDLTLFHESILKNVTLSDPNISRADTEAALMQAGAMDFVAKLPDGIDTITGERGSALSGGQRQRIAIARALVRRPGLLILDEPTAALDPETEVEICKTLLSLKEDIAILAISHQSAIAEIADTVYEMRDGGVTLMEPTTNHKSSTG